MLTAVLAVGLSGAARAGSGCKAAANAIKAAPAQQLLNAAIPPPLIESPYQNGRRQPERVRRIRWNDGTPLVSESSTNKAQAIAIKLTNTAPMTAAARSNNPDRSGR
ncbi:hypothetical protein NSE01_30260 [Novosphingobium sediminis]|uniref:Uncharacterized protein n=1 Tax=Novosphingobium sediminis TaxID=707214 RepID=A0A512ANC6_9SPHN|nr:hypothetical protein NSE01_30260 [Novosphingobium sediminis]